VKILLGGLWGSWLFAATLFAQQPHPAQAGDTYNLGVCVESFLSSADGHGGADYGYAFNAADAYLQSSNVTAGKINFCSSGKHSVWTPLVETWPVALVDGSGTTLVPQSGGASGIWGGREIAISGCRVTAGSTTVTCSNTTGLTANMAVGGIGLGPANRIVGTPTGTAFQLAIPASLVVNGMTTISSTAVCGLNTIIGLANGQEITGAGISASTRITGITSSGTTQCVTLSNAATATSSQQVFGATVTAPVALTISGTWSARITAEATKPVITIPHNSTASIVNVQGQNHMGKIQHLSIQDPSYRTLNGVEGIEIYGADSFQAVDLDVRNIRGSCLTLGGFDSTAPVRESFFSDLKCLNDGDLPTGQSSVLIAENGTSGNDEPNQLKFSGAEIVFSHGEGVTIGTYIAAHQQNNGPRLIFFSNNFQVEGGNADPGNPNISAPADTVHVLTGNQIYVDGAELAVPGYGKAVWRQDNVSSSNSYQVNGSTLHAAGLEPGFTVNVTNGSANITLPFTPTDNILDGQGVQIAGVNYWFIPQNAASGNVATLTARYAGTSGTATMVIGTGGYFFNNTSAPGVLDTRTTVGNIWTNIASAGQSLLGLGSTQGIDAGSLPARGEEDHISFQVYNGLGVRGTLTSTGSQTAPAFNVQQLSAGPYSQLFDDFYSVAAVSRLPVGSPVGDGCTSGIPTSINHPGILNVSSGTVSGTGVDCSYAGANYTVDDALAWSWEADATVPVQPGTTAASYSIGMTNATSVSPSVNGIYFYLSSTNTNVNNWYCAYAGKPTLVDTGVAQVTNAYHRFTMQSDGTTLSWYIDGKQVCNTALTNINASYQSVGMFMAVTNTPSTGVSLLVDYLSFQRKVTR
jgi:hypothetical protein